MIRAISFDFWNTLFTEQPGGFRFYQENRRRLLREALRTIGEFTDERINEACHLEAEAHHLIWIEEHRTLTATERIARVLAHLEACLPDGTMAEIVRACEENIFEFPPVLVDGVRETIEKLAGNYRLAIISDVGFSPGRVLKQLLRQNGLLQYFDSMVFSDEAGRSKPHREVFERTADTLRAVPREIVHIGDLEHTDIIGAKRAGFRAIRFVGVTPMSEDETTIADFVIEKFSELPRLVESFEDEDENIELAGSREGF
ncbi:MAG TPA: HAD family hydrolase [Blastocatellia bacterium]|nr:HAD family hydrolase [Blastocatellia bacterium]